MMVLVLTGLANFSFVIIGLHIVHQSSARVCTLQIRVFTDLQKTLDYARMIEAAGASLIAVHGRTREQKQNDKTRANWDYIKAC